MKTKLFSWYERFLIAMPALLNFVVFLGFVVLTPLGPLILKSLNINIVQYGWVV